MARLRQQHAWFNPPANMAHIQGLRRVLGISVNETDSVFDDLLDVYRDHNGMPISPDYRPPSIRMMSYEEAVLENALLREELWITEGQYLFWTDDNSNVMGVYLYPPLEGRVFFIDHEDRDDAPRFRSVHSFYESWLKLAEENAISNEDDIRDWPSLETDYPQRVSNPAHDAADLSAAQVYMDRYGRENDVKRRRRLAYVAMNLLPAHINEPLYRFVEDDRDMFVQERAIDVLAVHKDAEAIPKIERVIRATSSNPRLAGLTALGKIGSPAAVEALLRLIHDLETLGKGYVSYIQGSLDQLGYETRDEGDVFSYRERGEKDWIDIT